MSEIIDSSDYQVIPEDAIVGSGGGGCFRAKTSVQLKDGKLIAIEDIKVGDEVLSFDQHGDIHLGKVTKHHIHEDPQPILKVRFWGGEVFITPNHWVLNQYNAFVEIQTLVTGHDTVVSSMGHLLPILSKEFIGNEPVYNLTVEPYHTFIADGIRVHNGGHRELYPIVTGSGGGGSKGGGGGRQAVEDPDTLQSKATIKIIDLIGEGKIGGLVNGAKSIFLNDTALMTESGEYNFTSTSFDSRNGTPIQAVIKGFSSVESPHSMSNIEVTASTPQTFSITNLNADRIRIVMNIPALITQDKATGDIHGNSVTYHFEISTDGAGYAPIGADITVTGKVKSKYQRSTVIVLPDAAVGWTIKVVRDTEDSIDSAIINKTYIDSYVVLTDAKLNYPNSALISVGVDPTVFSSVPNRSYLVNGLYIQIPNNTNIASGKSLGTYTGIWNGGFTTAISSNPAWVLYDLLTNTRYGLGGYLSAAMVDKSMLYTIGKYCDVLVDDGLGGNGKEPRFSINTQIQTQAEAYKVISDITTVFRGMAYWNGGMVCFRQDSPQTPSMVFNQANVINGEFNYMSSSRKDRHSVVNVTWNDPDFNYKQRVEYVEDRDLISKMGIKKLDTVAFGCSSRGQANRVGKWLLYTESSESNLITFSVGLDSSLLLPGEIVKIADAFKAGKRAGGRILSSTSTSLTLDAPVTLSLTVPGNPNVTVTSISVFIAMPDGSFIERVIQQTTGTVSTITWVTPLAVLPVNDAVFVLSDVIVPMLARVISVAQNGKDASSFTVTATEHNPSKYSAIESGTLLKKPVTSIVQPYAVELSKLTLVESTYFVAPGVIASKLHISCEGQASLYRFSYRTTKVTATQGITGILGSTFNANFTTYFSARLTLINAFLAKVATNKTASDAVILSVSGGAAIAPTEKLSVMSEWDKIGAEKPYLIDLADTYAITAQLTAYTNAVTALNVYLSPLTAAAAWFSATLSTTIVSATFIAKFSDVYTTRLALLNAVAAKVTTMATASGVTILAAVGGATGTTLTAGNNGIIRAQWNKLYIEDPLLIKQAKYYGLTAQATTYHSAFVTLSVYLNAGLAWSFGAPSWISTVSSSNWTSADVTVPSYELEGLYEGNIVDVKASGKGLDGKWTTPITATITIAGKSIPPKALSLVTATSLIRSIRLDWEYPADMDIDLDHVDIRYSLSNLESGATFLASVRGGSRVAKGVSYFASGSYLVSGLVSSSVPYYFWLKTVDTSGNSSLTSYSISASTLDEAGELVATLAGKIGSSALNTELGTRINLIDGDAAITGSVAYKIAQEATARTAAILVETTARGTALLAEATSRGTAISAEQTLRTEGDTQLAQTINLLTASLSAGFDAIQTWYFDATVESWTGANATLAWATGKTTVTSTGTDPQFISPVGLAIVGSTYSIVKVGIKRIAGTGWDGTLYYARGGVTPHSFDANFKKTIALPTGFNTVGATAILEFNMSSLTVGGTDWTANTITQLRFDFGATLADVFEVDWVGIGRNAPPSAVSGISTEATTRAEADTANATSITTLSSQVNDVSTGLPKTRADLATEQTTRATADTANATNITTLSTQVNNATTGLPKTRADLVTETSARTTADTANATSISTLSAQVNNATTGLPQTRADLVTETTARTTADTALTTSVSTLSAQVNNATTGLPQTRADLVTETTARTTADTANALSVSTLSTTVNGYSAAISTQTSSINGLNAKITVKIDVNGYVSGYGLASETNTVTGAALSSFAIRADTFSIGAPAVPASAGQLAVASSKVFPFIVKATKETIDGKLFEPGVYFDTGFIRKLNADQIDTKGLTIRDATTGAVILGSGSGLDWANVKASTGRPSDGATVGAIFGTNITGMINAANGATFIDTGAIKSAYIGNAEVKTANIENLAVSTLKIQGNAVTVPVSMFTAGQIANKADLVPLVAQRATTTCAGGKIRIDFGYTSNNFTYSTTNQLQYWLQIIHCSLKRTIVSTGISKILITSNSNVGDQAFTYVDSPGVGKVKYELLVTLDVFANAAGRGFIANRYIHLVETKK